MNEQASLLCLEENTNLGRKSNEFPFKINES